MLLLEAVSGFSDGPLGLVGGEDLLCVLDRLVGGGGVGIKSASADEDAGTEAANKRPRLPAEGGVGTKSVSTTGFSAAVSVLGFFLTRIRFLVLLAEAAAD